MTLYRGVRWLPRAYEAAEARGILREVTELALVHLTRSAPTAWSPEVDRYTREVIPGRTRVTRDGVSVVLADDGTVLAFGVPNEHDYEASRRAASAPIRGKARAYRAGPRKARRRGPKDVAELSAWLRRAGYEVGTDETKTSKGHIGVTDPSGRLVYTLPTSASDHRSFANCVSDLRKVTGLELRT